MKGDKKGGPVAMEDDKHILFPSSLRKQATIHEATPGYPAK